MEVAIIAKEIGVGCRGTVKVGIDDVNIAVVVKVTAGRVGTNFGVYEPGAGKMAGEVPVGWAVVYPEVAGGITRIAGMMGDGCKDVKMSVVVVDGN
ncbi:MAG: hypothetical protein ABIK18_02455 [candidate division WOR-3 bacterium]